jgi:hypothetical protein
MAQSEYKDIRNGDWGNLRQFARRLNERLSVLEGYSGESKRLADLKMDGNQIKNGPWHQTIAESDEFVTKYMLDQQLLNAHNAEMQSFSQSSQISNINILRGPVTFTDFGDKRYWLPLYCVGHNGGGSQDINTDGSILIKADGPPDFTISHNFVKGVRSRFRILPDESQTIWINVKFTNPLWVDRATANGISFAGMILDVIHNGSTDGQAFLGQGVVGIYSNIYDSVASGYIGPMYGAETRYSGVNVLWTGKNLPIDLSWTFNWRSTDLDGFSLVPERFYPNKPQYVEGGVTKNGNYGTPVEAGWINNWSGISPILGIFQFNPDEHQATLTEFTVHKGIIVRTV